MENIKEFLLYEFMIYKELLFEYPIALIVFAMYLEKDPLTKADRKRCISLARFTIRLDNRMRIKAEKNKNRRLTLEEAVCVCWVHWAFSPELGTSPLDIEELWQAILKPIISHINYYLNYYLLPLVEFKL